MTGLTPDLIRAWEKRYAVVTPIRGARGARLYTAGDVAHLRLLRDLGHPNRVAARSEGVLEKLQARAEAAANVQND